MDAMTEVCQKRAFYLVLCFDDDASKGKGRDIRTNGTFEQLYLRSTSIN